MPLFLKAITVAAVVAGIMVSVQGQDGKTKEAKSDDPLALIASLANAKGKDQKAILLDLSARRRRQTTNLIRELDKAKTNEAKAPFVFLMGMYRLEETSYELTKIIELEMPLTYNDALPLWGQYPAVEALVKIGKPAASHIIDNIAIWRSDKSVDLSIRALIHIRGSSKYARETLQDAAKKEADAEKKEHLEKAAKQILDT